jgi:hypothetical protein
MVPRPFFPTHPLGMPEVVEISCPKCKALARLESPFWIYPLGVPAPSGSGAVVEWSGNLVQERFPGQVLWNDPFNSASRYYSRSRTLGVVVCSACSLVRRHLLDWPNDAFFHCKIRGENLWGWNRQHLISIQAYIASTHRNQDFPGFRKSKVPRHFLLAKNRDLVVRSINKVLGCSIA